MTYRKATMIALFVLMPVAALTHFKQRGDTPGGQPDGPSRQATILNGLSAREALSRADRHTDRYSTERWLAGLESGDPYARLYALGVIERRQALHELFSAAETSPALLVYLAEYASRADTETASDILWWISNRDPSEYPPDLDEAMHGFGDAALACVLNHSYEEIGEDGLILLSEAFANVGEAAWHRLMNDALMTDTKRSQAAVRLVAGIRNPSMRPYLEEIVHGSHEGLREAALDALGKIEIGEHRFAQAHVEGATSDGVSSIDIVGSGQYVQPKD